MRKQSVEPQYVVCVKNNRYPVSLELRKIYQAVSASGVGKKFIRVIDESGEDYLYPADFFVPIEIPRAVEKTFSLVA